MGDLGSSYKPSHRATLPSSNPTKSFWQTSYPNELVNHRSTSDLPADTDVIVIGSGITAVFALRELLQRTSDARVLVLEARSTCSGATGRNGGHLQPLVHEQAAHVIDFELKVFELVEGLIESMGIECDFRRVSGCVGFWNRTYFEEAKVALSGVDESHEGLVEVVEDEVELRGLRLKGAVGAFRQKMAASLSPYKLVIAMWRDLLKRFPERLSLQTNTPVTDLSGTTVDTSRGSVRGRHVIVACNGYVSACLPEFEGVITPTQGQMSASIPHGTYAKELLPNSYGFLGVGDQDRVMSDYLVQAPLDTGGHLMYGGGRAFVPCEGVGVSDDSYVDVDAEQYLRGLPERLDLGSWSDELDMASSWTGVMGYSKDHFPWVGAVPDRKGVWISAGYTGHGMTNAPGCGRYLAQLVAAAIDGKGLEESESLISRHDMIPKEYIVDKSRLAAATS